VPADTAVYVWQRLLKAGEAHRLRIGGHYAMEALRIARGVPRFAQEVTLLTHVAEIFGSQQIAGRVPVAFSSPPGTSCFGAHEAILQHARVVGEITSRACLAGWPETLSLGVLSAACESLTSLQMVANGRQWPLSARAPLWQP
jgi:hypothetical protein